MRFLYLKILFTRGQSRPCRQKYSCVIYFCPKKIFFLFIQFVGFSPFLLYTIIHARFFISFFYPPPFLSLYLSFCLFYNFPVSFSSKKKTCFPPLINDQTCFVRLLDLDECVVSGIERSAGDLNEIVSLRFFFYRLMTSLPLKYNILNNNNNNDENNK